FVYPHVANVRRFVFFFFQAEDGIRDRNVTGVQTCALPIYESVTAEKVRRLYLDAWRGCVTLSWRCASRSNTHRPVRGPSFQRKEIGRASCRERASVTGRQPGANKKT